MCVGIHFLFEVNSTFDIEEFFSIVLNLHCPNFLVFIFVYLLDFLKIFLFLNLCAR